MTQRPKRNRRLSHPHRTLPDLKKSDEESRIWNAERQSLTTEQSTFAAMAGTTFRPALFPLIFHSIPDEIPEVSRPLITRLFQLWMVFIGTLALNMAACIVLLVGGGSNAGAGLGASIGYLLFMPIASFLLWYRPIYNGYMKNQSLYFYIYFFFGGFHLLYSIYMIIGIPGTGSAGLISMIESWGKPAIVSGVFCTLATVGWILQGAGLTFYYLQIWREHNAAGHSLDKAKQELAVHGAKSYFSRG
ncbi:hypothetical protein CC1G_04202 [Coprinopsis cinerea okayama7|uniref:Scamp-domain-containing protein n=1 Tax=Coprinopsis cinerea (strain Okayama-7 / 130 / ATCC MYA-4618 / FGSC 9003) TaxID=240176 RepID=A8NF85_COPC7|nr:hypothetical protein CC1G_04202 [Coprinopsis cinerea okayama7\|eukprot:XP_001833223.1 hypothetical protein CC1G_04202 [Coprinopsis cinerea okayama7\